MGCRWNMERLLSSRVKPGLQNVCGNLNLTEEINVSNGCESRMSNIDTRHEYKTRPKKMARYGYRICNFDSFLSSASRENPANIPMVVSEETDLVQLQVMRWEGSAISQPRAVRRLPLGTVVNCILQTFAGKWLLVQTADGDEGFVPSNICIALGPIIKPTTAVVINQPPNPRNGHTTDIDEDTGWCSCSEKNVDVLYMKKYERQIPAKQSVSVEGGRIVGDKRKLKKKKRRYTLLIVRTEYRSRGRNTLTVSRGELVRLVHCHVPGWFWVRNKFGEHGFIPAVVAGYAFL